MPQMAPMSWLSLFMIFSLAMILFNIMNYFTMNMNQNKSNNLKNIKLKTMNWKW